MSESPWWATAIAANDLDGCVRAAGDLADMREWSALADFVDRCRAATQRGLQLWPAAEFAEYRIALDAPGADAAAVMRDDAAPFGFGPRPEVIAAHHTWSDLAPHLAPGPSAVVVLYERVVRGEDLTHARSLPGPDVFELPRALCDWEPAYITAEYHASGVRVGAPARPTERTMVDVARVATMTPNTLACDDTSEHARVALLDAARAWNGPEDIVRVATAVDGTIDHAIRACCDGPDDVLRVGVLSPSAGLQHLAWIAAGGGPHGRRRGAAVGRADAWHVAALLAGVPVEPTLDDTFALDPDALGDAMGELQWAWWDRGSARGEWSVGIAVADPIDGLAWALELR
jgi:hypothetical protein